MGRKNQSRYTKSDRSSAYKTEDYIQLLDATKLTALWVPARKWHALHGDCKSITEGIWYTYTMHTSNGTYDVRVMQGTKNGLKRVRFLTYGTEPSMEKIVTDLQSGAGKEE